MGERMPGIHALMLGLMCALQGCGPVNLGTAEPTSTVTIEGEVVERVPRFHDLELSDIDRDGRLDVVVVEERSADDGPPPDGLVTLFLQRSSGGFQTGVTYPAFKAARAVGIGDLNSDGWEDVVVGSWQALTGIMSDRLTFFLQSPGTGVLQEAGHLELSMRIWSFATGDLNGDGHVDIVVTGSPSTMVLMNDPAEPGAYLTGQVIDQEARRLVLADFDGDGHLDLALNRGSVESAVRIYLQQGGTLILHQDLETGGEVHSIAAADLNGDGRMDLIAGNQTSGDRIPRVSTFLQAGVPSEPGSFQLPDHLVVDAWPQRLPGAVTAADFDQDGALELAAIAGGDDVQEEGFLPVVRYRTHLAVLEQAGETFSVNSQPLIREKVMDLAAGDMNRDGLPDLVLSAHGVAVLYNRTESPGLFGAPTWIARGD